MRSRIRYLLSILTMITIFFTQFSDSYQVVRAATPQDFVIRSGSLPVQSSGIYAGQTKVVTIPANEVTEAEITSDNGVATIERNNNQVTITLKDGNPTSFTSGSTTLTDNGNTTSSGTASKVIPGLYDVTSKTTTNGTVTTSVSGDTLAANWTGGNKYQVRVPPYTQTTTTTVYDTVSHYDRVNTLSGCTRNENGLYTCYLSETDYAFDSNCNVTVTWSGGFSVSGYSEPENSTHYGGTMYCQKPRTVTSTVDVYNYEDRWDYSGIFQYRTASYAYNAVINYDYKDFKPSAPTLVAPQDMSDGGIVSFTKPSDDYTSQNSLLMSLEWQQEGSSNWVPIFTDKTITDAIFTTQGSNVRYSWNGAGVNGMVKLRLSTKDGYNPPVYSYMNDDPDFLFRMSHKPVIAPIAPSGGEQTNTVTPTYRWSYAQDEGEIQKGIYLQVRKVGDTKLLYDSGLIELAANNFTQPAASPLEWGSIHEWRIQPISDTGVRGEWSDWQAFGANEIPELESVTATSPTSINVKTKPTKDTTGYKYYRGGVIFNDTPGSEVTDTNLPANTEQTYNVRSYNAVAESPLSPSKSTYSLAALPEIDSIETTTTSILLKVKPVNPNYTNYEIEYRKKGDTVWLPFANYAVSNYLYIMSGLDKDTEFEIRLRAFNGRASSSGIATDYVTTNAVTKVDVPTSAVFTDVTEDSFTVTVDSNNNRSSTKYRFWIDGVTDKTEYKTDRSFTFTDLPQGNRTYTVVGQALGLDSESNPVELGTVTTKAYPIKAEDVSLTATEGKITGSFSVGKNAPGTQYEISDSATGQVLPYSDTNDTFELPAPNANEKHTITILARDQLLNVTDPVSKDIYSLSRPITGVDLKAVSPNEVTLSFDLNGNPMVTEVLVKSIQGDSYESGWVAGNSSLQMLNLTANTKQQYEIKTRNADGVESAAVLSPELYTLANRVTTANYKVGYENIKVTLLADNPAGTLYKITNKTTGDVRDWSPEMTWDNKPLANEEENEYEVVARNGDGIETAVVALGSIKTKKALGEYVQDPETPAPSEFNPDDRDGKTIEINGKKAMLVKSQELPLKLTQLSNVVEWRASIDDGSWSEWNTVQNGEIVKKFHIDTPGLHKISINFKNQYGKDAGTYDNYYLADWIAPNLTTAYRKVVKSEDAKFDLTYSDELSSYGLWYQVDDQQWVTLSGSEVSGKLPKDNTFKQGTVRISDIVGNVKEVPYEILSLNDQYVSFSERIDGFTVKFHNEQKSSQRNQVQITNLGVNENRKIDLPTDSINVTGLRANVTYDTQVGIELPGGASWVDPNIYKVTTKSKVDVDLSNVTLKVVNGKAKFDGLPLIDPTCKFVATLNKAENELIGTSPRFMRIADLEEWITYHLRFNQTYQVIFGIQIGDDDSTRVEKTFVLITDPDPKVEFDKKVSFVLDNLVYTVDSDKENKKIWADVSIASVPVGITVKGTMNGQNKQLSSAASRFTDLEEKAIYTLLVTITDGSLIKTQEIQIKTPDLTDEEQMFTDKVKEIISQAIIEIDGAPNSSRVWVKVTLPQNEYRVKITLGGKEFTGSNPYRMENVPDNTTYEIQFEVTDGKHVSKTKRTITTPNRTPPNVKSAYVDQNNVILIVESKSDLKKD